MMMLVEEDEVDDDNEEETMKRRNAGGRIRIIPGMPMIHSCTCLHRKYLITRSVPVSLSLFLSAGKRVPFYPAEVRKLAATF